MEGSKSFDFDSRSFTVESSREEALLEKLLFFEPLTLTFITDPHINVLQSECSLNDGALACISHKTFAA